MLFLFIQFIAHSITCSSAISSNIVLANERILVARGLMCRSVTLGPVLEQNVYDVFLKVLSAGKGGVWERRLDGRLDDGLVVQGVALDPPHKALVLCAAEELFHVVKRKFEHFDLSVCHQLLKHTYTHTHM